MPGRHIVRHYGKGLAQSHSLGSKQFGSVMAAIVGTFAAGLPKLDVLQGLVRLNQYLSF
ncbi:MULTISPECIES: hypothetical protein [Paenibacillus]|uniref:hypothetical protein n=1 Tax=Paenibacillus TaxID=44249 RepID=UPI0015C3A8C1|nr:hypothetical protein [Paenibacillus odorifer]